MKLPRRIWPAALVLCWNAPLAAQGTRPPSPDSLGPRAPRPDSLPGWPYLARGIVPVEPSAAPQGPLPPGSRYTFTRDSIPWSSAQTLSDLLGAIPGVYLARAGFLGLPEYVIYAGRGAAALELYWDGVRLPPLGGDSAYLDPATIPLTYLRRVDVEVLPATLRVYLVSERHESLAPRSLVRVMSGDFRSAAYTGVFQKRWASGLGVDLAGHFSGSHGASGPNRSDQAFDLWAKVEWLPTATTGMSYQVRRQEYDRDPVVQGRDGPAVPLRVPARHGRRTDALWTLFASSRPFDQGVRARLGLASSSWSSDSLPAAQEVRQGFLTVGVALSRLSLEATGRLADARTTSSLEARAGLSPVPGLVAAADAQLERHPGGRRTRAAHLALGAVRGPFSVAGEWSWRDGLQAPALAADSAQRTADRALRAGIETSRLGAHLALVRRDAYRPLPLLELPVISGLAPTRAGTYLVAEVRLQPVAPLALSGWYAQPRQAPLGLADFQPPRHGRAQLTFRSKFWRTFRSGAFDLKVQIALESWSRGTAGLDAAGAPLVLPGVTYYETFVAFQIVGFTAFWDLRDATNERRQYVPGLDYPNNAQLFGVRWEFRN